MQLEMFIHAHTTCGYCNELVHQDDVVVRSYHTSYYQQEQEHFCSDDCAQLWYLSQLRQWGL